MNKADRPSIFTIAVISLIAIVQLILGVAFVLAPQQTGALLGLAPAPAWTDWMFSQFGARTLGFAYGMALVLRDARRHAAWIRAMIVVQAIDWIGVMLALVEGKVTLAQVATAPFFPVLFIIVLAIELRRQRRLSSAPHPAG